MLERQWLTLNKQPVEDVVKLIDKVLQEQDLIIHIGTDAQKIDKRVDFVTCIALVRPSKGGRVFYTRVRKDKRDVNSLRQKLMTEAWLTLETAMELSQELPDDVKFVIHVDVNPDIKWESSRHINEVVGMIMGQGFDNVLTKPDAWLASHCADHAVKNKNSRNALPEGKFKRTRKK